MANHSINLNTYYIRKNSIDNADLVSDINGPDESSHSGLMTPAQKTKLDSLATVATSGLYNDLDNKPSIPKVFYGTTTTASTLTIKSVTVSSDFVLNEGTILFVHFNSGNAKDGMQLQVNTYEAIEVINENLTETGYKIKAKEVVPFVYNGNNFIMVDSGLATTTYYGVTKLSTSTSSTSTSLAATPNAVKQAYDLANSKANASHTHGNISNTGALSSTTSIAVDTSANDLLLFADASDSYKIKGSSFIDALNDIVLDLIDEGNSQ